MKKRDIELTKKTAKALHLRAQGLSYDVIAAQCGYSNRGAAYKAVQRELEATVSESCAELRIMQHYVLDELWRRVWPLVFNEKNTVNLKAVNRMLHIMEQEAKLYGLYPSHSAKGDRPTVAAGTTQKVIVVVQEVPMHTQ